MQVFELTIPYAWKGQTQYIHPVLIETPDNLFLVDGGYAGFMPLIAEAMTTYDRTLDQLTGIIITHHDIDHCGALAEIKEAFPHIKVYASWLEALYLSGKRKSQRLHQIQSLLPSIPKEERAEALAFQAKLESMKPVAVDVYLDETWHADIWAIPTPGHTLGHISLYIPSLKTLIAADAFVIEDNRFEIANIQYTLDLPNAIASIHKIRQFPIEKVICYHGGTVTENLEQRFDELLTFF